MTKHGVPDWYIWSCKKIKYMFPKAHAAAYVMMAWRIAYCKVFYPLAYYAAFFSIRASAFSYEIMCLGREKLEYHLADYKKRADTLSKKEQDTLRDMRIVQEMYARGFDFLPLDIYTAKARHFQVVGDKLMLPLTVLMVWERRLRTRSRRRRRMGSSCPKRISGTGRRSVRRSAI